MSRRRTNSSPGRRPVKPPLLPGATSMPIERLAHDGRGIGHLDGRVTFVEQGLPGEIHKVQFVGAKSKFLEAVSVACESEPSKERAAPLCEHYQQCGGCQLQHLHYDAQLNFKQSLVEDQCRRVGVLSPKFMTAISANQAAYRSRCRLSVNHKGQAFAGFRQKAQRQLVKLRQCPILVPRLGQLLGDIQNLLAQLPAAALGHIELIEQEDDVIMIVRHVQPVDHALYLLSQFAAAVDVQVLLQPSAEPCYFGLDAEPVAPELGFALAELERAVGYKPNHFTQVNRAVNQQMVTQALQWLQPQEDQLWLDLFCGVGNFSLPLAKHVRTVVGVEGASEMVEQAGSNASAQGLGNCQFLAGNLEQSAVYRLLPKGVHGVVLDPPRAGAKAVVNHLLTLSPAQILYVSCDPATFARDAKVLVDGGYRLVKIGVLDMFPQTMHVETMALFEL